tara:strand:- start:443 stop:565 length:123 start_codon:yes stop_codon:yes gene_type:complete
VSPDGEILSEKKSGEGIIIADIDTDHISKLRSQIPSLEKD